MVLLTTIAYSGSYGSHFTGDQFSPILIGDMGVHVNPIKSLCPGKNFFKIRTRVIRMWEVSPVNDPLSPFALHIVLIDDEGKKIEAIARKPLMSKFRNELCEGKVYRIWYFSVLSNSGNFMASDHEYKLIFNERTKVVLEEAPGIPLNLYSFKNTDEILATGGDYDFLIDVIGLVTNVSREKQYAKAGKVTRMIELELTDDKGKINCALFGNYVDVVKHYVATDGLRMPVVVLQFAKIKTFKGDVVIQNVMNATILLWNPDTAEAVCFRDGLALHGIDADMPLAEIDDDDDEVRVITLEEEFLKLYPRKNISELNDTTEDGIFIVMAKICGLVEGDKWWYSACSCHKAVTVEDGLFHCAGCSKFVLSVTPRFRIKLEVGDGSGSGVFVVFDTDCQELLNKTCKELTMASKLNGKSSNDYPNEIKSIIGRQMLFKVQKSGDHGSTFDDSYKVKKICTDIDVVETFKDNSKVQTPTKMISSPKFPKVSGGDPSNSGDYSANQSEIGPNVESLDEISPGDGSGICSSVQSVGSDGSFNKPAKRMRLRSIKLEKDYEL